MAEFLVRKREYWATVKPADWTQEKFDSRARPGDILQVQPDGYFYIKALGEGLHGWDTNAHAVIRVLGLSLKNAIRYGECVLTSEGDILIWP